MDEWIKTASRPHPVSKSVASSRDENFMKKIMKMGEELKGLLPLFIVLYCFQCFTGMYCLYCILYTVSLYCIVLLFVFVVVFINVTPPKNKQQQRKYD